MPVNRESNDDIKDSAGIRNATADVEEKKALGAIKRLGNEKVRLALRCVYRKRAIKQKKPSLLQQRGLMMQTAKEERRPRNVRVRGMRSPE